MELLLSLFVGVLYAAGFFLVLRRSPVRMILGLALLGHAANVLIFVAANPGRISAPLIPEGALAPTGPVADPLPQALVLTAIVIGFAVLAFALVLLERAHQVLGSEDLDELTDPAHLDAAAASPSGGGAT